MDYTSQFVDDLIKKFDIPNVNSGSERRLSDNLKSQLVAQVDNAIYSSLSYGQLMELASLIEKGATDDDVCYYLRDAGIDMIAIENSVMEKFGKTYLKRMKQEFGQVNYGSAL